MMLADTCFAILAPLNMLLRLGISLFAGVPFDRGVPMPPWTLHLFSILVLLSYPVVALGAPPTTAGRPIAPGKAGYDVRVKPFFETHCIRCHGPDTSKSGLTRHTLDGNLASGQAIERWEVVLCAVKFGDMPPEDEPQPDAVERANVAEWIDHGLRARVPHGPEIDGMPSLKAHLLNSRIDDIGENMVRRLLTYAVGRELTYRDRYEVEKLVNRCSENAYRLKYMIVSICQSSTFREAAGNTTAE